MVEIRALLRECTERDMRGGLNDGSDGKLNSRIQGLKLNSKEKRRRLAQDQKPRAVRDDFFDSAIG